MSVGVMSISIDKIGDTAGEVWRFLSQESEAVSILKLKTKLSLPNSSVHLALGWLARENKITLEEKDGDIFIRLKR